MAVTVREIAAWLGGLVEGDADALIAAARPLESAGPDDLTFAEDDKHLPQLLASPARVAVVPPGLILPGKTLIRSREPLMAFAGVVQRLHGRAVLPPSGVHPLATVEPSVILGEEPTVGPHASIGDGTKIGRCCTIGAGVRIGRDCVIGDDVVLHPNVVLYDGTVLGNRVILHGNVVLGADGFGYRLQNGRQVKVPQLGFVRIGDDVEIGACTTIDRGTFGATEIGTGTKIDNMVQIGHNCRIGRHNLIVSQVGIAGSCSTGDYVVIAGQVGIVDHVHLGDGCMIGAKAGVRKDVPPGARMLGAPATPEREQKRILMSLEKLPEMRKELRQLQRQAGLNDGHAEAA